MHIKKIKAGGINIVDIQQHVGEKGILFYNQENGFLRLGDGHTPGGLPVSTVFTATTATLGVIKVGANLTISADGTLSAEDGNYTLPIATTSTLGGVKVDGNTITIADGIISAAADLSAVAQHIIPVSDLTYDLGSTSSQWRSLYVGTNTIYIGGKALSITPAGNITVDGNPVIGGGGTTSTLVNGAYTVSLSSNGDLIIPNAILGSGDQALVIQNTASGVAYLELPVDPSADSVILANQAVSSATVTIKVGDFGSEKNWTFDEFGALAVPGAIYNTDVSNVGQLLLAGDIGEADSYLALPSNVGSTSMNVRLGNISGNIQLNAGNNKNWYFNTTGDLELPGGSVLATNGYDVALIAGNDGTSTFGTVTISTQYPPDFTDRNWNFNGLGEFYLPLGGAIQETVVTNELWGTTTTSITLVPAGAANGTQRLEIYSTGGGEGDHIHITSGDQSQTDLFLGNDTQYFAVAASGANYIQARNGAASPSPGTSAGAGSNVNIYAGNAGDNGGNVADGNSGGDVFIQSGISSSGLGGDILIITSSGPAGRGSIELSTDGGSSNWAFNKDNQLVFPDGTTSTGSTVYVPYATSSSFKITTELDMGGGPPYMPLTFEVQGAGIILPNGNGNIRSGPGGGLWALDSANQSFDFPNLSRINYGDGGSLSTGTLQVDVRFGGIFEIKLNDPNKTWTFDTNGDLTVPSGGDIVFDNSATSYIYGVTGIEFADATTQTTAFTGTSALLDITNTNGIDTNYYITFVENRTAGQEVRADVDLTWNSWSNTLGVGKVSVNSTAGSTSTTTGALTVAGGVGIQGDLWAGNIYSNGVQLTAGSGGGGSGITSLTAGTGTFVSSTSGAVTIWVGNTSNLEETFESKTTATGVVVHDCTTNRLFYHTGVTGNFTPNFTNLGLASGEATSISLVVVQGGTARNVSGVQIAGTTTGVTLVWQGSASAPSGNANRTDVFSFSILCTATNAYTVLGMLTSFGGL